MTRFLTLALLIASFLTLKPALTYANPTTGSSSRGMYSLNELQSKGESLSKKALVNLEDPQAEALLKKMGISKHEARERIAGLSDKEIEQVLNGQTIKAGGDILYLVLMVVLIIFVAKRI